MDIKSILLAVSMLALSSSVNAAYIDKGIYTTDDVSELDWLHLDRTDGISYNFVLRVNPCLLYTSPSPRDRS